MLQRISNFFHSSKAHLTGCALVFLLFTAIGQKNLVPNPSFELHSKIACNRIIAGGGADNWEGTFRKPKIGSLGYGYAYINSCSVDACCKVPISFYGRGFQYAHSGNAFVALFTYQQDTANKSGKDLRNYIVAKLHGALVANKLYYLEFYTNKTEYYNKANNNIGLLLSDTDIVRNTTDALNIPPTLLPYGNPVIIDSVNWTKVSGVYRAKGGEQYVLLGNFLSDSLTSVIQVHPSGSNQAAYFIDDVSVIPLDSLVLKADAGRDTTIYKGDSAWIGSRISGITDMHWRTAAGGIVADSVPGLWVKPTVTTTYILDQTIGGQYSKDTVKVTVVQPVPVLVVSGQLLVVREGKAVEFSWQTANEVNLNHFVIEQSPDGLQFQAAGTVNANGGYKYRFEIPTASISQLPPFRGWGYYRLKMVDKDGKVAYSKVYTLSLPTNPLSLITIIPNPAKDQITITAKNVQRYQIIDNLGRVLLSTKATDGTQTINVSSFSKGVYLVKGYSAEGNVETGKFMKE